MKRSGVSDQRGVDTLRNLLRNANTGGFAEVVDHLSNRGSGRVDPVDVSEERGSRMMIDIDDELRLQIRQTGPGNIGTLNHEDGVVRRIDRGSNAHLVGAGQLLVSMWDWIAHDHFDVFIECTQQPIETE